MRVPEESPQGCDSSIGWISEGTGQTEVEGWIEARVQLVQALTLPRCPTRPLAERGNACSRPLWDDLPTREVQVWVIPHRQTIKDIGRSELLPLHSPSHPSDKGPNSALDYADTDPGDTFSFAPGK